MGKNQQFEKFINHKSNAAKKEQFKQEKRAAKKEKAAAIEKRFAEKRAKKLTVNTRTPAAGPPEPRFSVSKAEIKRRPPKNESGPAAIPPVPPVTNKQTEKPARIPKPGSLEEKKLLQAAKQNGGIPATMPSDAKPAGPNPAAVQPSEHMPLNKFVAHSGVCSRRDAAELIRRGEVKLNNQVVTEPGTKVTANDTITVKGKHITPSRNFVYILLNKPKDYITTLEDPEGRKTVLDLIRRATTERVYPVGRLDRNTSGVLLITNDGELAQTLSHPKNSIKKVYEVRLDKPLTKADFEKLMKGIELEDGFIAPDALGFVDEKDKSIIGIEIHSGRNRIVRRIFEFLGYDVRQLDRVMYAGLTKKNVQRGKWRLLNEKEIRILRHFNPQTKKDKVKKERSPKPAKKK